MERFLPSEWQMRPCVRASDKAEVQDLACQGLTFLLLDAAARLFGASTNIVEELRLLSLLLTGKDPPYKDDINWLQFAYTGDRKG